MTIFDYDEYKAWVNERVESLPNKGRGQFRRIALSLNTTPTIVSQVFKGDRQLTPEQALLLSEYFGLSKFESRFLILLVNHARAGSELYRKTLHEEIVEARTHAREIQNRVIQNRKLSDETKAILYSNWYYLAIWSLTAIPGFDNIVPIAERLHLPLKKAREALDFLLQHQLVLQGDDGRLSVGPTLIHLESTSPQIARHHQNWRLQAFRHYENMNPTEVFYTAPVTLSEKDAHLIREKIVHFISETISVIKDSPSEKLHCLCLDWFEV